MKKVIYIIFFLSIILVQSCSSTKRLSLKEIMDSWLGHSKVELIESWGPPTSTYNIGNGNEVLTYLQEWQINGRTYYDQYNRQQYKAPQTRYCKKMMYVNKYGKIYMWKTEGYCQ